ncbi:MAG: hypothetical protein K2F72_04710, partial [Muribaculaceae bacterium]|nr:hypothetical protein [Muribaculaceae bacterium]
MLFAIAPVKAESTAGMTLNDCLIYAREHAFDNRINRQAEAAARAQRSIAAAGLMPYVGISASGSMNFGRNIDPETNMYDNN